jgi:hypothetical protein
MPTYSVYTGLNDRWTNFATRKFRRLLQEDPARQLEIRMPDGRYTFPANLVAHFFPQGQDVDGTGRRIVVTVNPEHQMKIHGVQERIDLAGFFHAADGDGAAQVQEAAPVAPPAPDLLEPRRGAGETEWHRDTVAQVAADPSLVADTEADPVIRIWRDSYFSADGVRLWKRLWCGKHPDVTLQHASGRVTVIEVEPDDTAAEGFAQLWGDYVTTLRVDRRLAGGHQPQIDGVLVVQQSAQRLHDSLGELVHISGVRIIELD